MGQLLGECRGSRAAVVCSTPLDQTLPTKGAQGDFTWLSTQNVSVQPQDLTGQHQSDSQSNEILELQQILIKLRSLNLFSRYLNGTNTEEETSSGSAGDQALSQILHLKKKPFYNDNSFQIFIFSFRFELLY